MAAEVAVLDALERWDAEQVLAVRDRASGLRAFICAADTRRGPAAGGTRCRRYGSEAEQLRDGLRLGHAMVRKMALAGRWCGGGKIVVCETDDWDRPAAFQALGRALAQLGGRQWTGPDLGVTRDDLLAMRSECEWVNDPDAPEWDGSATARTIVDSVCAAGALATGTESLDGLHVAVQGCGLIGLAVLQAVAERGARCTVADPDPRALERARVAVPELTVAEPATVLFTQCDVLVPCALGDVFTAESVPQLRCRFIAPGANNVLADDALAGDLHARGITYLPDYLCNSGAGIAWTGPVGPAGTTARQRLDAFRPRVDAILREASERNLPPLVVCEERVAAALAEPRPQEV